MCGGGGERRANGITSKRIARGRWWFPGGYSRERPTSTCTLDVDMGVMYVPIVSIKVDQEYTGGYVLCTDVCSEECFCAGMDADSDCG
jgi:hypothetical protein